MQFRLTYEGLLFGSSKNDTRASHKQDIRRVFHRQLRHLWANTPHLSIGSGEKGLISPLPDFPLATAVPAHYTRAGDLAERFQCGPYRLVPLVTEDLSLICGLDILLLRPDTPGKLIASGDIDNRLKTIFDALRIPGPDIQELAGHRPQDGENPFFCLLQDDKLINHLSVETDMLLQPSGERFDDNDSRVIITVRLRPAQVMLRNLNFA